MKKNLARSSIALVVIGIFSKIMGTVRTSLIARSFGQSMETDAYRTAYKIALLAMILINVSINSVVIPLLAKAHEEGGGEKKDKVYSNLVTVTTILNTFFVLLTVLFSESLARYYLPGLDQEAIALTARLTRIMTPTMVFIGMVNFLGAYQQSNYSFAPFAAVGIINNLIFFAYLLWRGRSASIVGLALITTVGAFAQFVFLLAVQRKEGLHYRWALDWRDPYLRQFIFLALPIIIASGLTQLNNFVTTNLASYFGEGAISTLDNSYLLFSAILQLIAATIATVVYPTLAAASSKNDNVLMRQTVYQGLETLFLLLVPISLLAMVLSEPIVKIVYFRGAFTIEDTLITQKVFTLYALGLLGHGLKQYLNRIFYAYQDMKTPMFVQLVFVLLNIVLAFAIVRVMDFSGLALVQSITGLLSSLALIILLKKRVDQMKLLPLLVQLIKVLLASLLTAFVSKMFFEFLISRMTANNISQLIALIISGGLGMILYFVVCYLLRLQSVHFVVEKIREKLKKH